MPILTGIDILGIQRYVFASNRLRDVLSASWMINHVTSAEPLGRIAEPSPSILLAAGGNAILEFKQDDFEVSRSWITAYTRWLYDTAPGLEVSVAHYSYETGELASALQGLQIAQATAKAKRRVSAPQLGLGVTAPCSVTGLPSVDLDVNGDLLAPAIRALRNASPTQAGAPADNIKRVWEPYLNGQAGQYEHLSLEFPDQLDHMGRSHGDTSLIGVVHVDGDSIGKRIMQWLHLCINSNVPDEIVRRQYGEWSQALDNLGKSMLHAIISRIKDCIITEVENNESKILLTGVPSRLAFELRRRSVDELFLPFRPILLGGDDLTFVCDGRIALDLAVTALREFSEHPIPHLGQDGSSVKLTSCGGVALVRAHAPFHRAYELCERLCRSAKEKKRQALQLGRGGNGCWIDWHVGAARPGESVGEIRERQYKQGPYSLTMRPYPLEPQPPGLNKGHWDWFETEILGPGDNENDSFRGFRTARGVEISTVWSGSRSRVKKLDSLLQSSPDQVKTQLEMWRVIEPEVALPGGLPDGFDGASETPIRDAVELLDLHLRLAVSKQRVLAAGHIGR